MWLPGRPARGLGPCLSCPVLSCLAVSSLGHFIRRLEEREFRERGAETLKINETPTISRLRGFFFFSSFLMGEEGVQYRRIVIYKCSSDEGFSNSNLSTEILTIFDSIFGLPKPNLTYGLWQLNSLSCSHHWSISAFPTDHSLSLPYPNMKKFLFMPGPHIGKQANLS